MSAFQAASAEMYAAQQQAQQSGANANNANNGNNGNNGANGSNGQPTAEDVDFEEVK
jgi:hypothetical protein